MSLPSEMYSNHPIKYRDPHSHLVIGWYMFNYWLSEEKKKKKSWFLVFVNFCAVNAPTVASTTCQPDITKHWPEKTCVLLALKSSCMSPQPTSLHSACPSPLPCFSPSTLTYTHLMFYILVHLWSVSPSHAPGYKLQENRDFVLFSSVSSEPRIIPGIELGLRGICWMNKCEDNSGPWK